MGTALSMCRHSPQLSTTATAILIEKSFSGKVYLCRDYIMNLTVAEQRKKYDNKIRSLMATDSFLHLRLTQAVEETALSMMSSSNFER